MAFGMRQARAWAARSWPPPACLCLISLPGRRARGSSQGGGGPSWEEAPSAACVAPGTVRAGCGERRGCPRAGGTGRINSFGHFSEDLGIPRTSRQLAQTPAPLCVAEPPVRGPHRSPRPSAACSGSRGGHSPQASWARALASSLRRTASPPRGPCPAGSLRVARLTRCDGLAVTSARRPGQEH